MPEVSIEQARELHRTLLIVDGHNDTPVERVHRGENPIRWMARDPAYHIDVPRMQEGNYTVGFMIVGNGPTANLWVTLERILAQIDAHPDVFMRVLSSADAERARQTGRIGALLAIEGAGMWLDGKIDLLRLWHRLGIRSVGITHGEGGGEPIHLQGSRSPFGPCKAADREAERRNAAGLTPLGREALQVSNELGLITDLAHINDRAFYEVLERSSLPPVMSHTAVFSQCGHWRCLTDDQMKALASAGGVMGISFVPSFIDPERPTVERMVDHICYAADLVGIDCVGIGTDFDGIGAMVPIVPDVSQLVQLTRAMMERGLSEAEVRKVWGENFLRVFRKTIDR